MSERGEYRDGEFCWVDLASTDFESAKSFYGELMGWEWEPAGPAEETGGYGFFTDRGKQVAGGGPTQGPGQPSAWSSYVKVADADAAAEKVKEAGGSVFMPPFELPAESGRMGVCQDPEGAFFSVMQQRAHKGAELVNEVGAWNWNNLMTRDPDGAASFYGDVFGWKAVQPDGAPDFIRNWRADDQRWPEGLAGMMRMGDEMPAEAPPHWQVYLGVERMDDAIEKISGGGGSVVFGPLEIPVGKIAVAFDPQQAAFALIEPDYPEPR